MQDAESLGGSLSRSRRAHEAFTFDEYYRAPGELFVPALDGKHLQNSPLNLLSAHNLVATDDDANQELLDDLAKRIEESPT